MRVPPQGSLGQEAAAPGLGFRGVTSRTRCVRHSSTRGDALAERFAEDETRRGQRIDDGTRVERGDGRDMYVAVTAVK